MSSPFSIFIKILPIDFIGEIYYNRCIPEEGRNWFYMKIVATMIGLTAVVLYILSYQMKHRKGIIFCNGAAAILYITQYILLSAFEGAAMDLLGLLPNLLAAKKEHPFIRKRLKLLVVLSDLLIIGAGAFLYKNIFSLLAIAGVLLEKGALWLTKEKSIRMVSLLATPCWLIYNLSAGAFGSALGNILAASSFVLAFYRYDWKGKKRQEAEK